MSATTYSISAFRGTPTSNQAPVALPQTFQVAAGSTVAITLAGSDPDGDPLTYCVRSQPTKGVLSGTAPLLSYTSTPGSTGTDSFQFNVRDVTTDSTDATVTLNITAAPAPASYRIGINFGRGTATETLTATDKAGLACGGAGTLEQPLPGNRVLDQDHPGGGGRCLPAHHGGGHLVLGQPVVLHGSG